VVPTLEPAGQKKLAAQATGPAPAAQKLPAGHGTELDAAPPLHSEPAGQVAQAELAVPAAYWPTAQDVHVPAPAAAAKEPAGHAIRKLFGHA
jgi:hypothetical protein